VRPETEETVKTRTVLALTAPSYCDSLLKTVYPGKSAIFWVKSLTFNRLDLPDNQSATGNLLL
jgi:hypothetical protein